MIKPEVVDKVLGNGAYTRYQSTLDAFIQEQTRAYANEQRYSYDWARGLKAQLEADLAFAEKVNDDYVAFLERVSSTGTAQLTEGEKILDVLYLAISILTLVNDVLDDMFALGFFALFAAIQSASVEADVKALLSLLERLKQALERAKREIKEAYAQTAIDLAIAGVLACTGPLGWVTLGAIGLGQIVLDTYIGPNTSDAATWGNRASTAVGTAVSASEKYVQASSKMARVAKSGGKVFPVVGFLFDVNEIKVGYGNVDFLKQQMADAKSAHDRLIPKLNRAKTILEAVKVKFVELSRHVADRGKGWTAQTRQTLEDEMRRSGYRPRV